MKRSRKVSLVLMGASAVTLNACGGDQDVPVEAFRNVEQCVATGKFTEEYCRGEWDQARQLHEKSAPRYADRAACEQEFGFQNCYRPPQSTQSAQSTGGFFVPFMAGYIISDLINNAGGRNRFYSQPLYRNAYSGGFHTLGNQPVFRSGNRIVTRPQAAVPPSKPAKIRTNTVSRSGFGSRSFGGGWGG